MNRELAPNPDSADYSLMKIGLAPHEQDGWRKCFPTSIPPGFRTFARWDGNWLVLGIEKIPTAAGAAPKPVATKDYSRMSNAELMTECGLKSLAYGKNPNRTDLLALLGA